MMKMLAMGRKVTVWVDSANKVGDSITLLTNSDWKWRKKLHFLICINHPSCNYGECGYGSCGKITEAGKIANFLAIIP